jgi:hypothetical protein
MTVRWEDGVIRLEGDCGAEEAETLLALAQAHPAAALDWSRCASAHTAVVQVLLAAGRLPSGIPEGEFLRRWILPALVQSGCREVSTVDIENSALGSGEA